MNNWEQWIDPWLASLRQAGFSGIQIERRAKMLGRLAVQGWRLQGAAELHTWKAFTGWVAMQASRAD